MAHFDAKTATPFFSVCNDGLKLSVKNWLVLLSSCPFLAASWLKWRTKCHRPLMSLSSLVSRLQTTSDPLVPPPPNISS